MTDISRQQMLKSIYYMVAVLFSCFTGIAAETNDTLAWFVLPGLVWGDETNGFRIGITGGDSAGKDIMVFVAGPGTNSVILGPGSHKEWRYLAPPNVKFTKVELCDTNGIIVDPLKGKRLDGNLPPKIPVKDLPRSPVRGTKERGSGGGLRDWLIGNPAKLQEFSIKDFYQIEKEGDYILRVYPVIYMFGTNMEYVDRVDLPCVTTKVHLAPSQ